MCDGYVVLCMAYFTLSVRPHTCTHYTHTLSLRLRPKKVEGKLRIIAGGGGGASGASADGCFCFWRSLALWRPPLFFFGESLHTHSPARTRPVFPSVALRRRFRWWQCHGHGLSLLEEEGKDESNSSARRKGKAKTLLCCVVRMPTSLRP